MTILKSALIATTMLTAAPALAETIHMGTMAWEDLTPITGITKKVLEDKGFEVEVEEFSEWGIAYAALARGDIDIMVSQTDYIAHDYWTKNMDALEKISPVSHGLFQSIAVPAYVDIDSIDELNAHAEQFGGQIVGIEPGSGLMRDTAAAVDAYGLTLNLVEGSTAAMTAAVKAATERQEWIAATVWEPSWMMEAYGLKFLTDPKGVYPAPQTYYWIGYAGFSADHPAAREAIASVYVPLADISAINSMMNEGKTMDEAVAAWIESHADLISRWEDIKAE